MVCPQNLPDQEKYSHFAFWPNTGSNSLDMLPQTAISQTSNLSSYSLGLPFVIVFLSYFGSPSFRTVKNSENEILGKEKKTGWHCTVPIQIVEAK